MLVKITEMLDIPNYITLPIEIGVAILILLMDRRQRKREADSIIRFQEQQKETRESEIRQRERFNNWAQESSKRQVMMLESIMATLDVNKVDDFKTEVGSRYAEELNQDMEDLDNLLNRKRYTDTSDPELEANIESKIEEIESAADFIEHFLPPDTLDQINTIADSAKSAYIGLKDLPKILEDRFPRDSKKVKVNLDNEQFTVDPNNPEQVDDIKDDILSKYKMEREKLFNSINASLKETLDEVARTKKEVKKELNANFSSKNSDTGKIVDAVTSSLMNSIGLDKIIKKKQDKDTKEDISSATKGSDGEDENNQVTED